MALSSNKRFMDLYFDDDGLPTDTSQKQWQTEDLVEAMYEMPKAMSESNKNPFDYQQKVTLNRKAHIKYLRKNLFGYLHGGFVSLDASKTWICYWIVHSLNLLDESLTKEEKDRIIDYISRCKNVDGGFGGGPQQLSHLAPTYAAVNCLASLQNEDALRVIDREGLIEWIKTLKQPDGSFVMHIGGEIDVRGAYCAVSVLKLCCVPKTMRDGVFKGTAEWIAQCQTYEGGISGVPGCEAHGGYGFCGVSAMCLLEREDLLDLDRLIEWAVYRQMRFEGGFQGRTNKLVDGCYSFWMGGIFPLIGYMQKNRAKSESTLVKEDWLFNRIALQEYILFACQEPFGGCIDKPGKSRDFYHTCYVLSGLSVAQHYAEENERESTLFIGEIGNIVETIDLFHNITTKSYRTTIELFEILGADT